MKKYILFVISSAISAISFSQIKSVENTKPIEIGKVGGGSMSPFVASLNYNKGDADVNTYFLMYNNLKYTTITDINSVVFSASQTELDGFYNELKNSFASEKGTEKKFELGKETVWVKTIKNLGVTSLQITTSDEGTLGYFYLTNKQLDKLFGK
jgi:hypothetical protein